MDMEEIVQEAKPVLTGTQVYAQEKERERYERRQQRRIKRGIKNVEITLKNTNLCRYRLVYIMQALDKIIDEMALRHGLGKVAVRLEGNTIIVEVENPNLTATDVAEMVDKAIKDENRYNLAKALATMDDFTITLGDAGGLKMIFSRRMPEEA